MRAIEGMTREGTATAARGRRGWPWAVGAVLAGAVLMFCYLRIAGATEVSSDGAGLVLQASDMLHGNLLLHGWWATDVSFITTELPEYMAVTKVAGVGPEVVHICAALTYTLLVLLAAFVARGRARGAEGLVAALLAAGVMLAPQPSGPTPVLLGSPDHVGTAVPLLLLLLLLDRAPSRQAWARWYIPVCFGVCTAALLTLTIVGDPLAEVVGVVPLALACLLQAVRIIIVRIARAWRAAARTADERAPAAGDVSPGDLSSRGLSPGDTSPRDTSLLAVVCYVLLAAAALAAVPLAQMVNSLITRHGGYQLGPARYHLLPWHVIVHDAPMVWQSVLAVFGADYAGVTGRGNVAFALVHLVGVAVVIAAVAFAAWRLIWPARHAPTGDLVADVLVLGVLVNVAAYAAGVQYNDIYAAHEIGPVVSFGAALAGRMFGGPLLRVRFAPRESSREARYRRLSWLPQLPQLPQLPWLSRLPRPPRLPRLPRLPWSRQQAEQGQRRGSPVLVPVLAAGLACYVVLLGIAAAAPQAPPQNATLATWLDQHHLKSGLASYWEASSVSVASRGKVTMLAIGIHGWNRRLAPDQWETDVALDDPATHTANFVVAGPDRIVPVKLALEMFGKPARTYHYWVYTIMVWNKNLLGELNRI